MEQRIRSVHSRFAESVYPVTHAGMAREECLLPMEDGARLRTIITKPDDGEAWPTILVRSCYPAEEAWYLAVAQEYALRGFAYVLQYCRGTGGSEGIWEPNVHERADGAVTARWLQDQPWVACAAYWGSSYLALTGWLIADILPPKFGTMYLTMYGTFRHVSAYKDGLFRHDVLTAWAMGNAGFPVEANYLASCLYRPHAQVDEALWGRRVDWYRRWVTSTDADDPYWNEGVWQTLKEIPAKVRIPISMSEGWYDHHLGSGIETYRALSGECRAQSEFLIGPWDHWFDVPMQDDAGSHYENDDLLRAFSWFHRILVEKEKPVGRVRRYIPRGDYWIEHRTYDIPQATAAYYLSAEGQLVADAAQIAEGTRNYPYDPRKPLYTHGGESMLETRAEIGSLRQPGMNYRADVCSYASAPLAEKLTICGPVRVRLFVSSDAEDTAFAAKLMDVAPDGTTHNIRGGITTLAYRNGRKKRGVYTPGALAEVEIAMWDVAWEFGAGHRIRLDIQSADFPQYALHSNTAGIWSLQTECKTATQSIHQGKNRPSCIILPVLA